MTWTILAVLVGSAFGGLAWFWYADAKNLQQEFFKLGEAETRIRRAYHLLLEDQDCIGKSHGRQTKRLTTKLLKARHLTGSLRKELDSYQKAHKRQADSIADLQAELDQTKESLDQSIRARARDERARTTSLDFRSSLVTQASFVSDPARVQWAQQLGTSQFWPDLIGVLTNATPVASGKSADYELGLIHGIRTSVTLLLSLSKHPVTNLDAPEPDYGAEGVMKNWDKPQPDQPESVLPDSDIPATFRPDEYV